MSDEVMRLIASFDYHISVLQERIAGDKACLSRMRKDRALAVNEAKPSARCRCGKLVAESSPGCIWHESRARRAVA